MRRRQDRQTRTDVADEDMLHTEGLKKVIQAGVFSREGLQRPDHTGSCLGLWSLTWRELTKSSSSRKDASLKGPQLPVETAKEDKPG